MTSPTIARPLAPATLGRSRTRLLTFFCVASLLYGGATFGWGPMQLILENNGVYARLCDTNDMDVCLKQRSALLLVSTTTSFLFISAPLWGALVDRHGPLLGIVTNAALVWAGLTFLVTAAFGTDVLLYPAFSCLMFGSVLSNILFVHAGLMFDTPEVTGKVIGLLNTMFDTGALTYLVLYEATRAWWNPEAAGWVFTMYLGLSVVVYGGVIWYWRDATCAGQGCDPIDEGGGPDGTEEEPEARDGSDPTIAKTEVQNDVGSSTENDKEATGEEEGGSTEISPRPKLKRRRSSIAKLRPLHQLRTRAFLFHAIFFGVVAARSTFVLSTAKGFLAHLGDDDHVYLRIFTLLQPASIVGLPFLNWVIRTHGYSMALKLIVVMGALQGVIQLISTNLNVQVVGFILFSFYRCFVFATCFGLLPTYLNVSTVGRGAGLLTLSQGVVCAVNAPLAAWAINGLGGDFFLSNLVYVLMYVPCVIMAWCIGHDLELDQQRKDFETLK